MKTCEWCGKEFESKHKDTRFCSVLCRNHNSAKNNPEKYRKIEEEKCIKRKQYRDISSYSSLTPRDTGGVGDALEFLGAGYFMLKGFDVAKGCGHSFRDYNFENKKTSEGFNVDITKPSYTSSKNISLPSKKRRKLLYENIKYVSCIETKGLDDGWIAIRPRTFDKSFQEVTIC